MYAIDQNDCTTTESGFQYAGPRTRTSDGLDCQPWADNAPNINEFINSIDFPEGSARGAGNKCRNPTANTTNPHPRLWCYAMTTDPDKKWGECAVPICGTVIL